MKQKRKYLPDTVAEFYATIITPRWKPMFRFSAVLDEAVEPALLEEALQRTLKRFPYFAVELREGFFRHYFADLKRAVHAVDDGDRPFSPAGRDEMLRVCFHDHRVSVEMQHILADGYGGITFLKTLLAQYFALKGIPSQQTHGVLDVSGEPDPGEYEDSYPIYGGKSAYRSGREKPAYHVAGRSEIHGNAYHTVGVMRSADVLDRARMHGVSITEYLSSVLAHSIHCLQRESKPKRLLPVKISITADLRRYYATKTMRNFAQYSNPGIGPGETDFEETIAQIRQQCRSMFTQERLTGRMGETVRVLTHPLIRMMPLFLKRVVVVALHHRFGDRVFTTNFSNLGVLELPETIRDKVVRFETSGSNFRYIKLECGAISYNGNLTVSFSSAMGDTRVQDRFFALLAAEGIPVTTETNAGAIRRANPNMTGNMYETAAFRQ